jgi:hypothetical protein
MKYPVDLYCRCGVRAAYPFVTEGARDEYKRLFNLEHATHGLIDGVEWRRLKKEGRFR